MWEDWNLREEPGSWAFLSLSKDASRHSMELISNSWLLCVRVMQGEWHNWLRNVVFVAVSI
ncbi:uncharacterized protein BKA55DRAFT_576173 [Fusarium redolens]|uniref:Uncharacterized protein n=1 Tax=Fusarium redolens TaxID=48865 RepID=A0A9P9GJW7_FUSRE|nr:uncharacterized protein BKA55DRAFT_576173 [Fusarium redolens]KAH7240978.1 hypothetical protein BKA55DRAFT_576173 [Fusarium redolens]